MNKMYLDFVSQYVYNVFQPIVCLEKKQVVSFELLSRLQYKGIHYTAYDIFSNASESVTSHIGKKNILMIARLQREPLYKDYTYTINLSSSDINNGASSFLNKMIERKKINPKKIVIEITEDVELKGKTIERIECLKSKGVKFAIDDFGNGYSTFNYLLDSSLSNIFDYVKLDGALIRDIEVDYAKKEVVKTILGVARKKSIKTIVEHIDSFDNLEIISTLGADYAQGYLFSKPLCYEDKKAFVEENNVLNIITYANFEKNIGEMETW